MTEENLFIIGQLHGHEILGETKTGYILPIANVKAMCILLNYALREGDIPDGVDTMGFEKREELQKYLRYEECELGKGMFSDEDD